MARFVLSSVSRGSVLILPVTKTGRLRGLGPHGVDLPSRSLFPKSAGERTTLATGAKNGRRVVLLGVDDPPKAVGGDRQELQARWYRKIGGFAASAVRALELDRADVVLPSTAKCRNDLAVGCFCEGFELGTFRAGAHKTKNAGRKSPTLTVVLDAVDAGVRRAVRRGHALAEATNYTRRLSHEPANVINPVALAREARALAKSCGLKCTVLDERGLGRLKMGGILAVGSSSASPPRLIVLEYSGKTSGRPVVLIGKAITFDTGGYSIKDKNSIVGMKYDKCGGTAVLGVMKAVAALRPGRSVVGIIAAAENMISGRAYRPSDIITMMSGQTVEIISTDAEGRMVLADALTYADRKYKPGCMIDLATLTGGVVVALGHRYAGVFCEDAKLRDRLLAAGRRSGERLWPMPMDDGYLDALRSEDADFKNSAGREGHASLGAVFLKQFANKKIPWAHVDIAGVATIDKADECCPVGATGFGVRLLCDFLESA